MLLAAAWLAVALLAPSLAEAAERQSATFGPIRTVPGTHLVIGGLNTGVAPVTIQVVYESSDTILSTFVFRTEPPKSQGQTGVRGFGGDSSGIVGFSGSPGVTVTITALEGDLADIDATLQLVDDETNRPIVVLAKPCRRCD